VVGIRAGGPPREAKGSNKVSSTPKVSYIICTTARSGSNLLCNVLRNTKQLGFPVEALNPDFIRASKFFKERSRPDVVDPGEFIQWLISKHQTANSVFGIKILYEDFQNYRRFKDFQTLFMNSKIIHLRRKSKVNQAVSYFFASETGQWVASDTPKKPLESVAYDFETIRRHYDRLIQQDSAWTAILKALRRTYIEVMFEDFISNMQKTLGEIATFLDVAVGDDLPIKIDLKEQANHLSRIYIEKFCRDYKDFIFSGRADIVYGGLRLSGRKEEVSA